MKINLKPNTKIKVQNLDRLLFDKCVFNLLFYVLFPYRRIEITRELSLGIYESLHAASIKYLT